MIKLIRASLTVNKVIRLSLWSCLLTMAAPAHAGFVVDASGTGTAGEAISATAEFDFVAYDFDFGLGEQDALQITLTNTSDTTSFRGNLLTSFFFSLAGVGALPITSAGFDGIAETVQTTTGGTTVSNVDIAPAANKDGTYQLSNGPFGIANIGEDYSAYDYGIATVGMGLKGFSGAAVGGDNYGIFASGSDLSQDGLPKAIPLIDTTAIFWILKPVELTSFSQLTAARFGFGSLPDNSLVAIPEPAVLHLLVAGIAGMWITGFSRRRRILRQTMV